MSEIKNIQVQETQRIDKQLQEAFPEHTRTFIQNLLGQGLVRVNGKQCIKKSLKVNAGDFIELEVPEPVEIETPPENLNLHILYEDEFMMVISKPWGMLTHPLHPGDTGTVVNGVLYQASSLSGINGKLRPGIVHRLDRDTTGVLVIAKTDMAHQRLQNAFANREVKKVYYAIVYGNLKRKQGHIKLPLARDPKRRNLRQVNEAGKFAHSQFRVISSWEKFHLVRVRIYTGRTHQIRVHLRAEGIPILGDRDYQGRLLPERVKRMQLHAFQIQIPHPNDDKIMTFKAPLPEDMCATLDYLANGD